MTKMLTDIGNLHCTMIDLCHSFSVVIMLNQMQYRMTFS